MMLTTKQPYRLWAECGDGIFKPLSSRTEATLLQANESLSCKLFYTGVIEQNTTVITNLGYTLPDKRDPLTIVVPMTVVYALLLVSGLIGNICTCVIIVRNKYMHTATNYYLFSLAISDLLLLVFGLPQEIYQVWEKFPYIFGEAFCIFRGLSSETSTNASILTITAFTVERYVAICHPLKAQTMSKLTRAIKFIVAIWLVSAMCAAPLAAQFGIVYEKKNNITIVESAGCNVKRKFPHSFGISTFFFFLLPMSVISLLYVVIAMELRRTTTVNRITSEAESVSNGITIPLTVGGKRYRKKKQIKRTNSQSSRRDVVKMLVAVVVAFFLCWAPFHAQRLMAIYVTAPSDTDELIYMVLTYISGITYYVSATINPILYSILSVKFRQAFKETLARCCGKHSPRRDTSYSFRYQSTVRTTAGYDASDLSSTYDSPKRRTERIVQYSATPNKPANSKSVAISLQRPEQNGKKTNHVTS